MSHTILLTARARGESPLTKTNFNQRSSNVNIM